MSTRKQPVILYSTSYHRWEVWKNGSVIGHGTLENLRASYPEAMEISMMQYRLAAEDGA